MSGEQQGRRLYPTVAEQREIEALYRALGLYRIFGWADYAPKPTDRTADRAGATEAGR